MAGVERVDNGDRLAYKFHCRVNFSCAEDAAMVRKALAVDPELRPDQVSRSLAVDGHTLVASFSAVDVRTLRAAVGSFCDLCALACRTIEAFKPAGEEEATAAAPAAAPRQGEPALTV